MSEAIELYKKDGSGAGIFYCSECRSVFSSEIQAANCHGDRLCACGEKISERWRSTCSTCTTKEWRADEEKKEAERFDKAKKITAAEYAGEMVELNDRYYETVEEALDQYLPGQEPEYVWACKNIGVPLADSENIVENCLEGMWEDADASDLNDLTDLDAAISAFNESNRSIRVFQPDYTTAILTSKANPSVKDGGK